VVCAISWFLPGSHILALTQSIIAIVSPEANTCGNGLDQVAGSFCTRACDKRDTDEPESSKISLLIPPTFPTILDACDFTVATTTVFIRLKCEEDVCCPTQTSPGCFPASNLSLGVLVYHKYSTFD